jgi:hypothetical protein
MKNLFVLAVILITNISYADFICGKVDKVVLTSPHSVTVDGKKIIARIAEDATPILLVNALANNLYVCIHTMKGNDDGNWIIVDSIEK